MCGNRSIRDSLRYLENKNGLSTCTLKMAKEGRGLIESLLGIRLKEKETLEIGACSQDGFLGHKSFPIQAKT